jgi:hypothetical protein
MFELLRSAWQIGGEAPCRYCIPAEQSRLVTRFCLNLHQCDLMNTAETQVLVGILTLKLLLAQNEDYGSQDTLTDVTQQLQGDFSVDGHCVVMNQVVERAQLLKIHSVTRRREGSNKPTRLTHLLTISSITSISAPFSITEEQSDLNHWQPIISQQPIKTQRRNCSKRMQQDMPDSALFRPGSHQLQKWS